MKAQFIAVSGAVLLFAVAGTAYSQVTQPTWSADQQSAAPVATGGGTTDESYGGSPMSSTRDSGRSRTGAPCVVGLSCDIYQGN